MTIADLVRDLAQFEPGEVPVLSVYLDMRSHEPVGRPGFRAGLVVLRDRLRELERTLGPRGPALESFTADVARLNAYLDEEYWPAAQGVAAFACHARRLFEVVEVGEPFVTEVRYAPQPDLFQLAAHLDEHEPFVVAVVDTNTARLFTGRLGWLEATGGPDDSSVHYRKRSTGGMNEARYQHHIDEHREAFARRAAAAIEERLALEGARYLILGGDEVAITPLREALSPAALQRLIAVLRIDMRAAPQEIARLVAEPVREAEAATSRAVADQLIEAVRADALGVLGVEATRRMLERGQAETLVIDPTALDDTATRAELVRLAVLTRARVEVVNDYPPLRAGDGVGAILRYPIGGEPR